MGHPRTHRVGNRQAIVSSCNAGSGRARRIGSRNFLRPSRRRFLPKDGRISDGRNVSEIDGQPRILPRLEVDPEPNKRSLLAYPLEFPGNKTLRSLRVRVSVVFSLLGEEIVQRAVRYEHEIFNCLRCGVLILVGSQAGVLGQTSAQELAANLRSQLLELETKQAALQTRLQELDEKSKPENIEKSFAGVGSTRPEDLREQKRRQLEVERSGVQKQLDLLATSRTRLEASIARAEAEAYRQSAAPQIVTSTTTTVEPARGAAVIETKTVAAVRRRPRKKRVRRPRSSHHVQTIGFVNRAVVNGRVSALISRSSRDDSAVSIDPSAAQG